MVPAVSKPAFLTTAVGVFELPAVFYGKLDEKGTVGYRPQRLGRFAITGVKVERDAIQVLTEGGCIRLHPSQVTTSFRWWP